MNDRFHEWFEWSLKLLVVLNLCVLLFSLFYVVKLFRSNLKYYRYYKYVAILDTRLLVRILFNLKTELYKYFLLGIILLAEFAFTVFLVLGAIIGMTVKNSNNYWRVQFDDLFSNCTKNVFKPHYFSYLMLSNPLLVFVMVTFLLLVILFFELFSFLCTYLKRRYNGHSLDNRVVTRYVVWWCIQAVLLFICAIPYIQVLIAVICPILLLINWIILVTESRRLSRAIRSVLYEILHFEYDDVRYKATYASYRTYRMFIRFQLIALLVVVFISLIVSCICMIDYFVVYNCRGYRINSINSDISKNTLKTLHFISHIISNYFLDTSILFYQVFTVTPLFLQAFIYLSRYIKKELKLLKYDRNLSQHLM